MDPGATGAPGPDTHPFFSLQTARPRTRVPTVCMFYMVCMVTMMGMECLLCKVGMVCMTCMFSIVCMGGVLINYVSYVRYVWYA